MCEQIKILEKIRKEGKMNGFGVELAEATARDFIIMNRKVIKIDKDVAFIKKEQKRQGEMLARQGGQIDLIVNRLNSPIEAERKDAIFWQQIKSIAKTPTGKVMILLMIGSIALAGTRILELLNILKGGF